MSKEPLYIFKVGGGVLEDTKQTETFTKLFSRIPERKLIVHGGGKKATELSEQLGVKATIIEGRRITNDDMLDVAVMVYAGLMNKTLVASLQAYDCNAMGLSGADGNLILAYKRAIKAGLDYGWAGDVDKVNTTLIHNLFGNKIVPVIASITHNKLGQLLNTNADTIAKELAIALTDKYETHLIFAFEYPGVMRFLQDPESIIPEINLKSYHRLKEEKSIHSGMIPKLNNAFDAIDQGVESVRIGMYDRLDDLVTRKNGKFTYVSYK